jgi:hypothetical protein
VSRKRNYKSVSARERFRVAGERRLQMLEESLVAALKAPMIKVDMMEVWKRGLLAVLRESATRTHRLL